MPLLPRCVAALLLGAAALTPGSAAAAPSPVVTATADAAELAERLRNRMAVVTAQLEAGTRRWEVGQAELARRTTDVVAAERRAEQSAHDASGAGEAVREIVLARYRSPAPSGVGLLLRPAPGSMTDALVNNVVLARMKDAQDDTLQRAAQARREADLAAADVQRAVVDTARLVQQQERDLRALQELAVTTAGELQAANARLQAVRLAALQERAARLALQQRQDREAKARARAAAAARTAAASSGPALPRTPAPTTGGAPCSVLSTESYANGFVDDAALCRLTTDPRHRLQRDAARAFDAMSRAHETETGEPLCITDSYRSYAEQVRLFRVKPTLAAVPGTSNHGWGLAVDLCGGVERFDSAAHQWMQRSAGRFGWVHPSWAQRGGSRPEAWHWEFGHL